MTRTTSAFLDLLRLGAAFLVFLAHTAHYYRPGAVAQMEDAGHQAVVVFFVLSGYVIAYTAAQRTRDLRSYAVARLSRLYSVVVPALCLTAFAWWLGRALSPAFYQGYVRPGLWLRYPVTALFCNEFWFAELNPITNSPFWSLGYEAWYYVLFGLALFVKKPVARWGAVLGCAALVGPKILVLMPAWLAGVAAYRWQAKAAFGARAGAVGLAAALLGTGLAIRYLPDLPYRPGAHPWYLSGAFIKDSTVAVGWALAVWCSSRALAPIALSDRLYGRIRWWANHTFSLYLYHAPLVILATSLVYPGGWFVALAVMGGVLAVVLLLGIVTEAQRPRWQRLFEWAWDKVVSRHSRVEQVAEN